MNSENYILISEKIFRLNYELNRRKGTFKNIWKWKGLFFFIK